MSSEERPARGPDATPTPTPTTAATARRPAAARPAVLALAAVAVTTIAVALAACGGSGSAAPAMAAISADDHGMLEFAACMRARGVRVADPQPRAGHAGLSIDLPTRDPATDSAYKACTHFLGAVSATKAAGSRRFGGAARLALIRYAECMRSHAVPMLDPNSEGALNLGNVPGIANGFGRHTPQFRAADRDCRHLLPRGTHDDGTGP